MKCGWWLRGRPLLATVGRRVGKAVTVRFDPSRQGRPAGARQHSPGSLDCTTRSDARGLEIVVDNDPVG
jgi:hypothetical protein